MKKNISFLLFFIFLLSCNKKSINPAISVEQIKTAFREDGFSDLIVPFSATPSESVADLQKLKTSLNGKQIVGMGEATHGSAEFQTIKHRYFQFLVTEFGFKSLVLEENFSAVVSLNEYIVSGSGNVTEVIGGLRSSMFKTKEFYDLVVWMRSYNQSKSEADKIKLYGMDAQNTGYSAKAAQKLIEQYDNSYLTTFNSLAASFLVDLTDFKSDQEAVAALPSLVTKADQIAKHVEDNAAVYAAAGEKKYVLLRQHIRIIQQALNQYTQFVIGSSEGFETRDKNMATNVQWVETNEGAGSKVMVWVHNGHINLQPSNYFSAGKAINTLGTNLRKAYGSKFYSIGFLFNQGGFSAVNEKGQIQNFIVKPYPSAYLSNAMATLNTPIFFYDLALNASKTKLTEVFSKEYNTYTVGASYFGNPNDIVLALNFSKEYDGLIFIDTISAFNPL